MEKVAILGYGEVGKAVAEFYDTVLIKDKDSSPDSLKGADFLHVCIPYSKNFTRIVRHEIALIKPRLTIIHSTCPIGTTRKIGGAIVHSPIRGVHPHLVSGLYTFTKYIGADDEKCGRMARMHLESGGFTTRVFRDSRTTEALKLWDTTQYGVMILLNKEIFAWCKRNRLDFEKIYSDANRTYNEGYMYLMRPEVVRPILKYQPGPIGGHCVVPNCWFLKSPSARRILKQNLLFKSEKK